MQAISKKKAATKTRYQMFFLSVDKKLSWINSDFASDAAAIAKAQASLKDGETVKVYAQVPGQLEGRVVWDSEVAAEEAAWQARMVRDTKRIELRDRFQAIMDKANVLFEMAGPNRHRGHQDAWLLCASAMDNASDTCTEKGWEYEGLEYWECALGSLECLCCYASPRVRRWFKKIGFKF